MEIKVLTEDLAGSQAGLGFISADGFLNQLVVVVVHSGPRTLKTRFGDRQFYEVTVATPKGALRGLAAWSFLGRLTPEEPVCGVLRRKGKMYVLTPPEATVSKEWLKKVKDILSEEVPF
ncbi:MAG: hypothetical protein QXJ16_02725 [Desulfurococcaceae archaeon]